MNSNLTVSVIIPCFKVRDEIKNVLDKINYNIIEKVYVVDDFCPEKTGKFVENYNNDKVEVIYCNSNQGVGGATMLGFNKALENGYEIVLKLDGDGQHDPLEINKFLDRFSNKKINYCKGSRFKSISNKKKIPFIRLIGNIILTKISQITCKNKNITDVVNGFLCIRSSLLKKLDFNKISKDFFFEEDLLFQVSLIEKHIEEIEIKTFYSDKSNLKPLKTIMPFLLKHLKNYITRIKYDIRKKN